ERRSRQTDAASHRPTICPLSSASGKQGEDTGVAINPVAADLPIGEEADQRELAQSFADQPGLHPGIAEQSRAASDAAHLYSGFWWSVQSAGELVDHPVHVALRAFGIAAAEQDRIAGVNLGTKHYPAASGVDGHQIADKVIAGIRTGDR